MSSLAVNATMPKRKKTSASVGRKFKRTAKSQPANTRNNGGSKDLTADEAAAAITAWLRKQLAAYPNAGNADEEMDENIANAGTADEEMDENIASTEDENEGEQLNLVEQALQELLDNDPLMNMEDSRRLAVAYCFIQKFGAPDDTEETPWNGRDGIIRQIRDSLGIPIGSDLSYILKDVKKCQRLRITYTGQRMLRTNTSQVNDRQKSKLTQLKPRLLRIASKMGLV